MGYFEGSRCYYMQYPQNSAWLLLSSCFYYFSCFVLNIITIFSGDWTKLENLYKNRENRNSLCKGRSRMVFQNLSRKLALRKNHCSLEFSPVCLSPRSLCSKHSTSPDFSFHILWAVSGEQSLRFPPGPEDASLTGLSCIAWGAARDKKHYEQWHFWVSHLVHLPESPVHEAVEEGINP